MAVVEGRLQLRDWQDNNGNKRRSAEIVADNVYFGDSSAMETADISRAAMPPEAIPHRAKASAPRAVLMALLPVDIPHRITAGALRNSARMTENCRSE